MSKQALILFSGGIDSTTILAIAKNEGYQCFALSFSYGQRHVAELNAAKKIASAFNVSWHRIVNLHLDEIGGSALTDQNIAVPDSSTSGIPVTYVPARNTIFLSYALACSEVLEIDNIFIGVNAVDYSGYPDCRPEYIEAFQKMANLATKVAVEGRKIAIHTPLINMSKAKIIKEGIKYKVDYALTVSCYQADDKGRACGKCESCYLRKQGFVQAGVEDNTCYQ